MTRAELLQKLEEIKAWNVKSLKHLCTKFLNTPHWSQVHNELDLFMRTAGNRIHIELPRGHLKSWIITKGWAIQQVLRNPNVRILIVNATEENAVKFMRTTERYLGQGSILEKIYGRFESPVWNQNEFIVRQRTDILDAPTMMAAGLQKTLTSQHYDVIIADDLVEPDNCRTKEQREKVHDFYLSLFDLLEPTGRLVVIGTRYHQDDLYARILDENEQHKNWSVFIRSCYHPDGSIVFPEKFTQAMLDDIKKKSFYHFSTQYLNNPIDPENADFKTEWIKNYDLSSANPSSLYLTIDPAISLSRDADYSAFVVAGMFSDRRIRVVDAVHKRLVPSDLVDTIFALVKKWRLHRVGIETFAFQKTLKYDIQRKQRELGVFFSIDELGKRHSGRGEQILSKEARIRRLQPYFEQGLVELRSDMSDLREELLAFPRGKHDDLIDALSYQLDYLVPSLGTGTRTPKEVEGSMGWWIRNKMPEPKLTVYDRFFADLK
jgi:predicted phage terminase large subunit-like protein